MNRVWIVAAVGALALAGTVGAVLAGTVPDELAILASDALVLGFAAVAALLGLLAIPSVTGRSAEPVPSPPSVPESEPPKLAETIDVAIERPRIGESTEDYRRRERYRRRARSHVRELAASVLADRHGLSNAEAAERIRDGTWSDDPRAVAFCSRTIDPPARIRFVDWLHGVRFRRGLEAAIDEVERLETGGADR